MGDDILHEEEVSCPCGNGTFHIEIYEHDTGTSSGRHKRWWVNCKDCKANYASPRLSHDVLISKEDADEIERRSSEIYNREKQIGELAAERTCVGHHLHGPS